MGLNKFSNHLCCAQLDSSQQHKAEMVSRQVHKGRKIKFDQTTFTLLRSSKEFFLKSNGLLSHVLLGLGHSFKHLQFLSPCTLQIKTYKQSICAVVHSTPTHCAGVHTVCGEGAEG